MTRCEWKKSEALNTQDFSLFSVGNEESLKVINKDLLLILDFKFQQAPVADKRNKIKSFAYFYFLLKHNLNNRKLSKNVCIH
jgi:hypothetical protein